MIDWPFPGTLQDVWSTLTSTRQHEIALDCASTAERRNIPVTTRLLANALSRRAQDVVALGPQELARHIVTYASSDPDALDEIFRVYFSFRHKRMVARFLDIQVRADATSESAGSKQARAQLETGISTLLREFRYEDVVLYTQVLSCQNPSFWGDLSRVNFQAADIAPRLGEPPAVSPGKVTVYRAAQRGPASDANPSSGDEAMRTAQELHSDLRELTDRFSRAADELEATLTEIRQGKLPSAINGSNLENLGPAFARLVYDVCARSSQLGVDRPDQAFNSLSDLSPAIAAIEEKEKAMAEAQRNAQVLEQVLELTRVDGHAFQPLDSLKESARSLQQELSGAAGDPDAAAQQKLHAFQLVLQMVESSATGEDENAEEVVAEQFGAKLLYALGTGKIVRTPGSHSEPHSSVSVDTDPAGMSGMEILLEAAATSNGDVLSEPAAAHTDVA